MCDFNLPNSKPGNGTDNTPDSLPDNIAGKLIAWLDGELPDHEAILVERHVRACAECRSRIDSYEAVSSAFNEYCNAVVASKATALETPQHVRATQTPKGTLRRWVPVIAGAAAAVAALFLVFPRVLPRIQIDRSAVRPQAAASPADAPESLIASTSAPSPALVTPGKTVRKPQSTRPTQTPTRTPTQSPGQTREPAPSRAPRPSQILDAGWVPASPAIRIAIPAEAMFPPGAVPEGVNFTADFSIAADGSAAPLRFQPRPGGAPIGTQVHYERKPTRP